MSDCIPIEPEPGGVNPPEGSNGNGESGPRDITKVIAGDCIVIDKRVTTADGDPVTPENSQLLFRLVDQRFSACFIWEGRWNDGIEPIDGVDGGIRIKIPDTVSARLRRGSFLYSLRVSDNLGNCGKTVCQGSLLVEYAPTSPIHNIPYHDGCKICDPMEECPECSTDCP